MFASSSGATALDERPGFEVWNRYPRDAYTGSVPDPSLRAWREKIWVLILNGDVDKAIMHGDAEAYARDVDGFNVRFWTVPHAAHTTVGQSPVVGGGPACGARIVASFVGAGNKSAPLDVSCLRNLAGLDFEGTTAKTLANVAFFFNVTSLWGA